MIILAAFLSNLTSKQKKVYSAIESYIKLNGIPPTVREIGEMVGEKTPGAVQGILNRLELKGVIKRQLGMARSIQLVSEDEELYVNPTYVPEIKKVSARNADDLTNMYNIQKYHPVSSDLLAAEKKYIILKCTDNNLATSGIKNQDMLLICLTDEPKDGDIALAIFDNHVLLRRFNYGENPSELILKADLDLYGKEVFDKSEIKIIGRLVGKIEGI